MESIFIKEHKKVERTEDVKKIDACTLTLPPDNSSWKFLGLNKDYWSGYFIGARWLMPNELALVVEPKIDNLDYLKMFCTCLENSRSREHVSDIYEIIFDEPQIDLKSSQLEITPLIIIHFLMLLKNIVHKGLKRDYIWIEENLQSKIKGKLLMNHQIKKNLVKERNDRNFCRYQEYSVDCVENRILKKCLTFVRRYLSIVHDKQDRMASLFAYVFPAFAAVSDEVTLRELKGIRHNSLFKEYNEALRVAEMILKRFSYSIEQTAEDSKKTPPFTIDMSKLFELYVLTKLDAEYGNDILFQYHGKYGESDFIHITKRRILDAKYKIRYHHKYAIEDIRQLSGYARDVNVLKKMNVNLVNPIIPECFIIYPNQSGDKNIIDSKLLSEENEVKQFLKFYKYGIKLPMKNQEQSN